MILTPEILKNANGNPISPVGSASTIFDSNGDSLEATVEKVKNLIIDAGESNPEVVAARTDSKGVNHETLGERLSSIEGSYLAKSGGVLTDELAIDMRNEQQYKRNLNLIANEGNEALINFSNNSNVSMGYVGYKNNSLTIASKNTRITESLLSIVASSDTPKINEINFYNDGMTDLTKRSGSIRVETNGTDTHEFRGKLHLRFMDGIYTHCDILPSIDGIGLGKKGNEFGDSWFKNKITSYAHEFNATTPVGDKEYTRIDCNSYGVLNIAGCGADWKQTGGISFGDRGQHILRSGDVLKYTSITHEFTGDHILNGNTTVKGGRIAIADVCSIYSSAGTLNLQTVGETKVTLQNDSASTIPCFRPQGNTIYLGHQSHPFKALYSVQGNITVSDKRLKSNIKYLDDIKLPRSEEKYSTKAYNFVKNLKFANYNLKEDVETEDFKMNFDSGKPSNHTSLGFIAQDLVGNEVGENILVKESENSPLMYSETEYINTLALALQEAIKEIENLKAKLSE